MLAKLKKVWAFQLLMALGLSSIAVVLSPASISRATSATYTVTISGACASQQASSDWQTVFSKDPAAYGAIVGFNIGDSLTIVNSCDVDSIGRDVLFLRDSPWSSDDFPVLQQVPTFSDGTTTWTPMPNPNPTNDYGYGSIARGKSVTIQFGVGTSATKLGEIIAIANKAGAEPFSTANYGAFLVAKPLAVTVGGSPSTQLIATQSNPVSIVVDWGGYGNRSMLDVLGLPSGLTCSCSAVPATITGTPTEDGTFTPTFELRDLNQGWPAYRYPRTFQIIVGAPMSPTSQTLSGTAGTLIVSSQTFTLPVNFNDVNTYDPATYTLDSGTLPAGLTLSASSGVISGTPTSDNSGTITIRATANHLFPCCPSISATATVTFAIAAAATTTTAAPATTAPATTAPATTSPATTAAPVGPVNVTSSNQATLTRTPGAATAVVNGQPVTVAVETPADLPAAQVDPEDRSPAQVAALQTAADNLVDQLNQAAGGNSGLAVQDTPTGAAITGLLDKPVPIENTVLVEAGTKSTLFAALNQDGSVTEVQPGAVIEVLGDGQVGVVASGLTPGETAEFVIMSTPTLLGSYTVSANGTIKAQTSLPDGIGLGNHTLVVASPTVQASLGLKVSATPSTLPATGASSSNTMQIALFLMVGGLMVAFLRRRGHILN